MKALAMPDSKPGGQQSNDLQLVKPPFKREVEQERLYNRLHDRPDGEFVTYDEIETLIGEDPRDGAGYGIVARVRKRLIREKAGCWFAIPGRGLQKANEDELLELVDAGTQSVRRKNRRNGHILKLAADKYAGYDKEQKKEFNFLVSMVGAIGLFFERPNQKQLRKTVDQAEKAVEAKNVLRLFGE